MQWAYDVGSAAPLLPQQLLVSDGLQWRSHRLQLGLPAGVGGCAGRDVALAGALASSGLPARPQAAALACQASAQSCCISRSARTRA